jgi:hypothetical protein
VPPCSIRRTHARTQCKHPTPLHSAAANASPPSLRRITRRAHRSGSTSAEALDASRRTMLSPGSRIAQTGAGRAEFPLMQCLFRGLWRRCRGHGHMRGHDSEQRGDALRAHQSVQCVLTHVRSRTKRHGGTDGPDPFEQTHYLLTYLPTAVRAFSCLLSSGVGRSIIARTHARALQCRVYRARRIVSYRYRYRRTPLAPL